MITSIDTRNYSLPPVSLREVLRYSGCAQMTDDMIGLANDCIAEAQDVFCGKVCFGSFPICECGTELDLGFARTSSAHIKKYLEGCRDLLLFVATVGHDIDRLIKKYTVISPAKAVILQGLGAERIEALCDLFCRDIEEFAAKSGFCTLPRFSPGYGDLPLELQRDIFRVLDCPKRIGATLTESLLISPSKSVSAIVGLKKCK